MSEVKWIKINIGMFDDEKIKLIETLPEADSILVVWLKLLILAGKNNMRGEIFVNEDIPYTEDMLATVFGRKISTIKMALKTFTQFRMVEIQQDRTIAISNWSKHQNVEGLEKIRKDATERQRRFRDSRRDSNRHVTCHVTPSYAVTNGREPVTVQIENENKNRSREEKELPLPSPKGGSELASSADSLQYAEAKLWLNALFSRKRSWSYEEDHLLSELMPISREEQKLIDWTYHLSEDHEYLQKTKRKQELTTLLRGFNGEIDKIRSVRKQLGMDSVVYVPRPEPAGWREYFEETNPGCWLPRTYWELSIPLQEEFETERQSSEQTSK